jgi:hypothetical protein
MKTLALALLAFAALSAADKPTPRQKARELLDSVVDMAAAAKPDVQAAALMHLAEDYYAFDKKKSLEFFKQAFTVINTSPASQSPFARSTQMEIAVSLAGFDAPEGIGLLKLMEPVQGGYDVRSYAASRIMSVLVGKQKFADALDLAEYMGSTGAYPFSGVGMILDKLPAVDPQIAAVFSSALAAFTVKPDTAFSDLLNRHWKQLPAGMPQAALSRILAHILNGKDDQSYETRTLSSSKGTAAFSSRLQADLFDIAPLVRELDPKRYEELLSSYAELRGALQIFPGGGPAVHDDRGVVVYTVLSDAKADNTEARRSADALNNRMKTAALINQRSEQALAAASDPDKALDLVAAIPSQPQQAVVLARIANAVGENDVARARRVLSRCLAMLDDVKYPEDRVNAWDAVAAVAVTIKDDAILQRAIDRMISDAAALYKEDSDSDKPNRYPRDQWPSTQAYRRAVIRAVKLQGVDAEPILQKIADTDQNILARLTMAQALLERSFDANSLRSGGGRRRPEQTGNGL